MKSILRLTTGALLSLSLFSGCIEETFPTNGATAGQVADSSAALDAMVNAIPSAMMMAGSTGAYQYGYPWDFAYPAIHIALESLCEDLAVLGDEGYDHFAYYSQNLGLGDMYYMCTLTWDNYYPWIKSCNDIISTIKNGSSAPNSQAYLGIAYAYRAICYLDLVRLYEGKENEYAYNAEAAGLAVPIVTEETTEDSGSNNPRATVDQVYELIFSDLKNAEECLDGYKRTTKSRPDLSVVYGVYARAYLERGELSDDNYAKAAEYARKAIDASGCTPLTQDQWFNGFNSTTTQDSWMWAMVQEGENVSNLMNFVAYMSNEQDFGYGLMGQGVAYCISKRLYDQIPASDFRKYSWIDPARGRYHHYQIIYPNRDEFLEYCEDYANIKFKTANGDTVSPKTAAATDIPLMRVEEMYLIEAEAAGKANLSEGKRLLNEFVKTRNASYDCSSISSFEEFQRAVILQKRIEFWGEGIVLFDYKRLRLGVTRGYDETNFSNNHIYNCEEIAPWWNLCIPRSEIQNNSGITQSLNNPDPSGTVR